MSRDNTLVASPTAGAAHEPGRWPHLREAMDSIAARAIRVSPATVIRLADTSMRVAGAAHRVRPTATEISTVFGPAIDAHASEIAWRSAALRLKNHVAIALVKHSGIDALAALIDPEFDRPPAALREERPVIFVSCHVGAHNGVSASLRRWGLDVFALPVQGIEHEMGRAAALRRAVDVLRDGGRVLAVMDGPYGSHTSPIQCLGRRVVFRRGAFALARLTGAPLLPFVARWTRKGTIVPVVQPELSPPAPDADVEATLAASAAQWLDGYLRQRPEEAWPFTIANLLSAPLADERRDLRL